ncbi:hypothetical protein JW756_00130 [Candidatus Woesearchaeota archaeon]|nr:hypothetical protein [Candidatus Woesearchaeota archaeon]
MDAIIIFNRIRDIPLRMPEFIGDDDYRCWGKNRKLHSLLRKEGYEVRFRVCEFNWPEQKLPAEIIKKCPFQKDQHLFLEIKVDGEWHILDCSNDSQLPKHNVWDGKADCQVDVKYSKIFSPGESIKLENEEKMFFKKNFLKYKDFFILFNKFLDEVRNLPRSY